MINTKQELIDRISEAIEEFKKTTGVRVTNIKIVWDNATAIGLSPNHVQLGIDIDMK